MVALTCGLILRGLRTCINWRDYQDVPDHVRQADLHFLLLQETSYHIKDMIEAFLCVLSVVSFILHH